MYINEKPNRLGPRDDLTVESPPRRHLPSSNPPFLVDGTFKSPSPDRVLVLHFLAKFPSRFRGGARSIGTRRCGLPISIESRIRWLTGLSIGVGNEPVCCIISDAVLHDWGSSGSGRGILAALIQSHRVGFEHNGVRDGTVGAFAASFFCPRGFPC